MHIKRLALAFVIALSIVLPAGIAVDSNAAPGRGVVAPEPSANVELQCDAWAYTYDESNHAKQIAVGYFDCWAGAGGSNYRAIQVCLYTDGGSEGCTYATSTSARKYVTRSCWIGSYQETVWVQSWYWFRDQFGSTKSGWGEGHWGQRC